jgi:hypothetical protein
VAREAGHSNTALQRHSQSPRRRGAGVVLSAHRDELFHVETEDERLTLKLERRRARCDDGKPHPQYRFAVIERESLDEEKQ